LELLITFFNGVLHLDSHLIWLVQNYGNWVYVILFLIIFCETGLVIMPFLPGDSLLFMAGTVAASGTIDVQWLILLLIFAASLGDNTNYWIGRYFGPKMFNRSDSNILNFTHLRKTEEFYERHGGKAIIFARFLPIIRTFTPFVAGIGCMVYVRFFTCSLLGSIFWINFFVIGGYFFGGLAIVRDNLTLFIFGIIFASLLPGIIQLIFGRSKESKSK